MNRGMDTEGGTGGRKDGFWGEGDRGVGVKRTGRPRSLQRARGRCSSRRP